MKKLFKWLLAVVSIFSLLISSLTVSAQGLNTFRHANEADESILNVMTRESYVVSKYITASDFGLDHSFEGLSDIYVADDGLIYVLCGDSSLIFVLNNDYSFNKMLEVTDNGEEVSFSGARGIYAKGEKIYICDTENARIIVTDKNGQVNEYMTLPDSSTIPDDLLYQPTRIATDNDGYTYILSLGCYYGALVYSPDGEFNGFYGSNTVKTSALDTLEYLWDLLTSNDTKSSQKAKTLPYSFVDLCFDKDGYMITCTGTTSGTGSGQLRKISPGGSNILFQRTKDSKFVTSDSVNFIENKIISRFVKQRLQNIVAVDVNESGYFYALDQTYGLIYVYDEECNLISAFGGGVGAGERKGTFIKASALALNGTSVIVGDSEASSITVFDITEYGKNLMTAQSYYLDGDYTESEPYWNEVLAQDSGNQLAYKGLAMISYINGDYSDALKYAKLGKDYSVYDLAYQEILNNFFSNNFVWLFPVIIVLLGLLIFAFVWKHKHNVVLIKNQKLKVSLSAMVHPFDAFTAVKYKQQGSWLIAVIIVLLFYVSTVLKSVGSSFLFTTISVNNYNMLYSLAQTVGLVLLWAVINWLMCTLFSGKGNFKEVFVSTSYCLQPIIIMTFIRVIASYILPLSGMSVLDGIYTVVLIYTFFLLCIAMMTVHEFSFSKFILTSIVTVLCMLLFVFIMFMMVILLQQFGNFIYSVYMEIAFR